MNASIMHTNLGHETEAWEYAQRAMEHSHRATPARQAIMEAWTYAMKEETYGLAIEAGKRAARLNEGPGQDRARHPRVHDTGPRDDLACSKRSGRSPRTLGGMRARKLPAATIYNAWLVPTPCAGTRKMAEAAMREYVEMFPDRAAGMGGCWERPYAFGDASTRRSKC